MVKVGGFLNRGWTSQVEVLGANGSCNQILKPLPVAFQYPSAVFFEGKIIVCGYHHSDCYVYKRDTLWNSTVGEWERFQVS